MSSSLTLEQRWEIQDLYARYALALDVQDVEAMVGLFVPEGVFETHGTVFRGHKGLRFMAKHAPQGLHLGGQHVVERAEFGATGRQQLLFVTGADHTVRLAIYDDEFVLSEAGWRFRRRHCRFITTAGALAESPDK